MVGIHNDDAVFRKRKYVVTVEPDAYSEDSRPHCLMAKKTPPVEYIPDGPIMSCLKEPQLMVAEWRERSAFSKNLQHNNNINREWRKKLTKTTCCGRYIKE